MVTFSVNLCHVISFLNFFQVSIMKMLGHPNIVNLIEVINDPLSDHFYMGIHWNFIFFTVIYAILLTFSVFGQP